MSLSFSGENNRIDGYTYDTAGNLLNDGSHNYMYDAENHLIQVDGGNTATYTYDALGRRVERTHDYTYSSTGISDYAYDLHGHLFIASWANPNGSGACCSWDLYLGDRHVYYVNKSFSHTDWLGTERYRGSTIQWPDSCTSLPFGDALSCTGSPGYRSTLHFTGQQHDFESDLDNFGARFYSSQSGRFVSPDDPFADQDTGDPQSWNLYSYVRNNPINNTDPDGQLCVSTDQGATWHDDNSGGETCKEVDEANKHLKPSAIVGVGADEANLLMLQGVGQQLSDWRSWDDIAQHGLGDAMMVEGAYGVAEAGTGGAFSLLTAGEPELPELLPPAGQKMAQIIARLGIGRGNPAEAMKALSEMRAAAAEAGRSVTGDYINPGSTIFRQGNDYLTVAKDGRILSFVKNAIPNERVALKYTQLGGK